MEFNKIYKGDCLEIMKQIKDKSVDMILCDLPYGKFKNHLDWDNIINLKLLWIEYKRIIKDNGAIVLTAVNPFGAFLIKEGIDIFRYSLVWEKDKGTDFGNSNIKPINRHEDIHIFYKNKPIYNPQKSKSSSYYKKNYQNNDKSTFTSFQSSNEGEYNNAGDRFPTSIIYIARESCKRQKNLHPTQKPIELFEYLIKTYTNEGDLVLDNCIGSGTTAVACIQSNRNFIGIEKEGNYCEIANKRIKEAQA